MIAGTTLQGTVTGFKRAIDLIKAINDLAKSVNINAVTIELQQIILDAQAAQSAMVDRIRELEARIVDLEAWDAEKENYKLAEWKHGIAAYVPKECVEPRKELCALCATCYDGGKKSVLQSTKVLFTQVTKCAGCKSEITTTGGF